MYWYGWLVLSFPSAAVLGWIATLVPRQQLLRATVFSCVLAALWPAVFAIWTFLDDRSSFDTDFVRSVMWMSAIPGFAGAVAASYFVPIEWVEPRQIRTFWLKATSIMRRAVGQATDP